MRRWILSTFVGGLLLSACTTPNIVVSEPLKTNTSVYEVKGRQGWQFNQVIRYGEFYTSKVKRGWRSGYDFPFAVRFQKAKEKLSFTQNFGLGGNADVLCVSKFKNTEISGVGSFFSLSLDYENSFAGSVKNDNLNWDFILYEPEGGALQDITSGEIVNQLDKADKIEIKSVRKMEGQMTWLELDVYGFEFYKDGNSIAAVSLINNGRVWMSNSSDEDTKLVLSSVISGLLVRHSMKDSFDR